MRISSWNQISIGTRGGMPASTLSSLLWNFFKARNCVLRLLGMLWPRTDMGEAKSAQSPRNGVLAHRDTELPLYHANQIDTAPAHDAIPCQVWPLLHDRFQRCLLLPRELAWPPW